MPAVSLPAGAVAESGWTVGQDKKGEKKRRRKKKKMTKVSLILTGPTPPLTGLSGMVCPLAVPFPSLCT